MSTSTLVQKVWSFANVLRDDGVGYGDYLEQITYLLFLKMVDEQRRPPYDKEIHLPAVKLTGEAGEVAGAVLWETLANSNGAELETFYNQLLRTLATQPGMLGQIFTKSQNKIQDPAKLARVVRMIDEQKWTLLDADVKGATSTKAYCKRTPKTPRAAPASTSPPAPSTPPWWNASGPNPAKRSWTRPAVPAASSWPPTTS